MRYIGPQEYLRRLRAGWPLTAKGFFLDGSDWVIEPMTAWEFELLQGMRAGF